MAPQARAAEARATYGVATAARLVSASVLAIVVWWVRALLGGVSASPDVSADGAVNTGRLFNW
jgi:hypothetical protein